MILEADEISTLLDTSLGTIHPWKLNKKTRCVRSVQLRS